MNEEKKKHKIGNVTAIFMLLLAAIADGLQFLLTLSVLLIPLSLLLTFLCGVGFALWFLILGAYSGKGAEKKILTSLISSVAELIPLINAVPAITAGVLINIALSRLDDAHISLAKPDPKKMVAAARSARMQTARSQLRSRAQQGRAETQEERHAPANDNQRQVRAANDNQNLPDYRRPGNDNQNLPGGVRSINDNTPQKVTRKAA